MTATVTPTPVPLPDRPRRSWRRKPVDEGAGGGQGHASPLARGVVLFIVFLWIMPVLGVLITSFRRKDDANNDGWWNVFHEGHLTFANYSEAISKAHLGQAFVNSLAIALPATFIPILIAAFAAYAFTFMRFPFRDTLFILIVSMLVVPNYVAFVPLLKLYGDFHMVGKFPAVWLAHIGFGMSLAIYILRNYMATLPNEVIESAKIDGATHFQFIWVWNDLLTALVFIGPGDNQPLTVAVSQLIGQQQQGWQLVTAGGFFSMVVPILVFLSLQRFFVRGLTAGSVKG